MGCQASHMSGAAVELALCTALQMTCAVVHCNRAVLAQVGRVRQDAFLFETLTVRESLTFTAALRLREKTPAERKRRVEEG